MTMMESLRRGVRQESALEIAQKLAQMGLDTDTIKKATNLSDAALKKAKIIH